MYKIEDIVDKVHCADCLEFMREIPDNSIDLVVTSPPYNVGKNYGKGRKADKLPFGKYYAYMHNIMKTLSRIIVVGGRICVEIGGSGRNFPLSWGWQDMAYKNDLGLYSEIIIPHRKTNPTAWGSWLKADNVYTIPNFHLAYVFYKETSTKSGNKTEIHKGEFTEWTRGHWKINYSHKKTNHPAEFPIELPTRFLRLFGHDSDLVLDPFLGSGTTVVACKQLNRRFIGIEINPDYCKTARERLAQEYLFKEEK